MAKIWITRSEPGASRLAQEIKAAGHQGVVAPVLQIQSLQPWRVVIDGQQVMDVDAVLRDPPDLVIALSAHAVHAADAAKLLPYLTQVTCLAVGEQTAAVFRAAGLDPLTPATSSSEGLLAMPQVQRLKPGQTLWLLAGVGGRDLIPHQLQREHQVQVVKFELYERCKVASVDLDADAIDLLEVLIVQSVDALDATADFWSALGGATGVFMIVPSTRVAEAAAVRGFTNVAVARNASAQACIETLRARGF